MRRPGDARGSRQRLALRISRYIMRDGLLPTDALLISYLTGRGVGAGGTAADPLAGTLDASGAWLLQLGLRWAEPRVLVPGLNPMLALRDYCAGLGAEFCDTVTSALHLAARHRLSAPPPQFAQALAVPGSQLDTTQPFPPSVACTDLATSQPIPLRELAPDQVELVGSTQAVDSAQAMGSMLAGGSTQAVVDSLVGAAVARIDRAEVLASERLEQLVHTSARAVVATA